MSGPHALRDRAIVLLEDQAHPLIWIDPTERDLDIAEAFTDGWDACLRARGSGLGAIAAGFLLASSSRPSSPSAG